MILPISNFNIPPESLEGRMMREIQVGMQKQIEELKKKILADAAQKFEEELRRQVGNFAVSLANYYTIERVGGNLVITVKIEAPK